MGGKGDMDQVCTRQRHMPLCSTILEALLLLLHLGLHRVTVGIMVIYLCLTGLPSLTEGLLLYPGIIRIPIWCT